MGDRKRQTDRQRQREKDKEKERERVKTEGEKEREKIERKTLDIERRLFDFKILASFVTRRSIA